MQSNSVIQVCQNFGSSVGTAIYTLVISMLGIAQGMKMAFVIALVCAVLGLVFVLPLKALPQEQTAKKSRREIEANRRRNCAAVIKDYEKTSTRTALGQRSSMQGGRSNGIPSDSEMHKSERQNSAQIEIVLHGYFQKSRYNTNKNAALHSPAENGGV